MEAPLEPHQLTKFPAKNLPEPRLSVNLRHDPVRYAYGQEPSQIHVDRWYCCQCAQREADRELQEVPRRRAQSADNDRDSRPPPGSRASISISVYSDGSGHGSGDDGDYYHHDATRNASDPAPGNGKGNTTTNNLTNLNTAYRSYVPEKAAPGLIHNETIGGVFNECPEPACGHVKCRNCVLGCWSRKSARGRSCIRTVGGLHASPKFVDPLHWECLCGEWEANWFGAHCVFDDENGNNANGYGPLPGLGLHQRHHFHVVVGGGGGYYFANQMAMVPVRGTGCANPRCVMIAWKGDVGRLTRQSVVMNKYGQRLGTADQKIMVAGGPWHLQRLAMADPRSALVRNMRPRPFRPDSPPGSLHVNMNNIWEEGELAPDCARPGPPVTPEERDDRGLFVAYEMGYLNGIPLEPLLKGKDREIDDEWYDEDGDEGLYMDHDHYMDEKMGPDCHDLMMSDE